ncbi:pilus assembly FimT family protein [Wenzhouxiangella limi]|uniref:Type II secretion system protein H n=1 Tax=Wenzhouxiangella limi TaxID=2707351 RepID=A0A845V1W2_9GAMM|nr:GspH/FimT family pseudopilin [Wenzhouxiangella limi]NDY94271.1 hypothetical protein [Wenzhouxiangella limi]
MLGFVMARNFLKQIPVGITLIELMVVIVVASILITLATPGLQNFIRNNRVTAQSNELSSLIAYARSQASASVNGYQLIKTTGSDSWTVEVQNLDCSPACVVKQVTFENTDLTAESGSLPLIFNDRSVLSSGEVTLAVEHEPCSGQRQRAVLNILISGSVRRTFESCSGT